MDTFACLTFYLIVQARKKLMMVMASAIVMTAGGLGAWASAAASGSGEKLHIGQKVANHIRT